jgi:hypothetical protein
MRLSSNFEEPDQYDPMVDKIKPKLLKNFHNAVENALKNPFYFSAIANQKVNK